MVIIGLFKLLIILLVLYYLIVCAIIEMRRKDAKEFREDLKINIHEECIICMQNTENTR